MRTLKVIMLTTRSRMLVVCGGLGLGSVGQMTSLAEAADVRDSMTDAKTLNHCFEATGEVLEECWAYAEAAWKGALL